MAKQAAFNNINSTAKISPEMLANLKLNPELVDDFNAIFKEAAAATASVNENPWINKKRKKEQLISNESISLTEVHKSSLAQLTGVANNTAQGDPKNLNIVPLQIFLDNAIRALSRVSRQESKVNDLIEQFVEGKVSEDEVVLETTKLNLAISMITTIVQSAVQTFKEIQQIPV